MHSLNNLPLSESQFPRELINFKEREQTFKQLKCARKHKKEVKKRSDIAVNFMRAMNDKSIHANFDFKLSFT